MTISRADAAASLLLAERAGSRSRTSRGYQAGAPHLMLWGVIYALGYAVSQFLPGRASAAWIILVAAGTIGSTVLAIRNNRSAGRDRHLPVVFGIYATFLALLFGTVAIMRPTDPRQMAAFAPLLVSAGYVVLGLATGFRLAVAGLVLAVLTLFGFFALPSWFFLWMAVCGGGALLAGGVWLRRV